MMPGQRPQAIAEMLNQALNPMALEVRDDSHHHVGHAGARDGRGHFHVRIVAAAFEGKALVARHRMVYAALGEFMHTDIHALAIDARTPSEVVG
jgi:BolA protein